MSMFLLPYYILCEGKKKKKYLFLFIITYPSPDMVLGTYHLLRKHFQNKWIINTELCYWEDNVILMEIH